jgi:hypothetical protein
MVRNLPVSGVNYRAFKKSRLLACWAPVNPNGVVVPVWDLRPKRVEVPAREVTLLTVPTCLEKTTRSSVVRLIDEPQARCRVP